MSTGADRMQFLTLNKKAAWDEGLPVRVRISEEGIKITEAEKYVTDLAVGKEAFPAELEVRDYAVGWCNMIYLLDQKGTVWLCDSRRKRFERICCTGAYIQNPLSIAITADTVYIGDGGAGGRIFAFALVNWQLRWCINIGFPAVDLAVDEEGRLFALDAGERRVLIFNTGGCLIKKIVFDGPDRDLTALTVSRGGMLYSFDRQSNKLLSVDLGSGEKNYSLLAFNREFTGLAVDTRDSIFIGCNSGIYKYDLAGKFTSEITAYSGTVKGLAVDGRDKLFVLGAVELTILTTRTVLARPEEGQLPKGLYFSKAFDSTTQGTRWHKFLLDAKIPENTQIKVSYLIAEHNELDDYITEGSAAAEEEKLEKIVTHLNSLNWSPPLINPGDALVLNDENNSDKSSKGRYLWLRIELIGNEAESPILRSIRVYLPRSSYLRYLPAVYQEDDSSRDFLERFLSLFETFFSKLEEQTYHVTGLFDPFAVPGEFLNRLAVWLGIAVDENWPEEKLRQLINKAMNLYRKRGTCAGIEEMIRLYTGIKPYIIEHFKLDWMQDERLKELLYGNDPNMFTVLLNPVKANKGCFTVRDFTDNELETVQRILSSEKPAHTDARLVVLQPWIYLDLYTYLGVNTCLSEPSPCLDTGAYMPRDTVLTDFEVAGQIERRSRMGLDTILT
ncbi:phage tail protein [Desulfosporosinus sp. OT]|uniref:phage tail protein n=1 Tax=Desulfosporosinus sp. OT TaxID=913865 RepID=UPI000223B2FB|nr:phage tail protein [Desulfosporosinus sp. OT]EGW36023.1 phage tail domain protein [Desulfosporosinus sp. OT]